MATTSTTTVHLRRIKRPTKNGALREEWHLRWHGTDGRHYCKKLGDCGKLTKREAEAQRRTFQVEMDRKEVPRDKPRAMTLEQFAEHHNAMIRTDRKPSTLYQYIHSAQVAAEAIGKTKPIQAITSVDVARLKASLGGSAATRAKHISRLRAMFNHAKRWGLIHGDNPFANQPMPRFTARAMRLFSTQEIEAMLAEAGSAWWEAFILVAVTAGPRKEEIVNLLWRDVDITERTISITAKNPEEFTGPDGKTYSTLGWSPKTYAIRTIPIPDRTVKTLSRLREQSDGSPYVFVSLARLGLINAKDQDGSLRGRAETCNNLLRGFRVIQKRAAKRLGACGDQEGWPDGTIHDLRRTYGSRMADVVPMHVLQKWMGHSDISVTARFYLGQADRHAEAARVFSLT